MLSKTIRKFKTLVKNPKLAVGSKFKDRQIKFGKKYLEDVGVYQYLITRDSSEIPIDAYDLYNLHKLIRKRKPSQLIELGSGFSTIVQAHALMQNHQDNGDLPPDPNLHGNSPHGILYSREASEYWFENSRSKIPDFLLPYVDLQYSPAKLILIEGELCHCYTNLPNINPDFFYLDGPAGEDVEGTINGLSFISESGKVIPPVSADPLFYESRIRPGCFIVIDARNHTMHFLERHLKRKYKKYWNQHHKYFTLELIK